MTAKTKSPRSEFQEWIQFKMPYDKIYPIAEQNLDLIREISSEINNSQDVFILKISGLTIKKTDNTKNPRLYFVNVETEEWDEKRNDFKIRRTDVPQRHQLSRIISRKNPELGYRMMMTVKYEIDDEGITWFNTNKLRK